MSPKSRLSRLFHRRDHSGSQDKLQDTQSPPATPSPTSKTQRNVQNSSPKDPPPSDMMPPRGQPGQPRSRKRQSVEVPPSNGAADPRFSSDARASNARISDARAPDGRPSDANTSYHAQMAAASAAGAPPSRLPPVPHETDLSADLRSLSVSTYLDEGPHSEKIAERNLQSYQPAHNVRSKQASGNLRNASLEEPRDSVSSRSSYHSATKGANSVSNFDDGVGEPYVSGSQRGTAMPLRQKQVGAQDRLQNHPLPPIPGGQPSATSEIPRKSLSREGQPAGRNRRSVDSQRKSQLAFEGTQYSPRSSLEKNLPPVPSTPSSNRPRSRMGERLKDRSPVRERDPALHGIWDSKKPIDITGIVDLSNTEDTTLDEKFAPAVTHETITVNTHEIIQEQITREIHNHHVYHRVLPIIDIELLPTRHYVPVQGKLVEISPDEVPNHTRARIDTLMAEVAAKMQITTPSEQPVWPRQFTARKFEGNDEDFKEYVDEKGIKRSEQWWVHPPRLEDGAQRSGQTYPFYFGSEGGLEDGIRTKVVGCEILGSSVLHARQRREKREAEEEGPVTAAAGRGLGGTATREEKAFV